MMTDAAPPALVDVDSSMSSSASPDEPPLSSKQKCPPCPGALPSPADTVRLDFGSIQYCGIRQQELDVLLGYATCSSNKKPAIWVEAEAGVGKSALLQQFKERTRTTSVILSGKFEERAAASEPFAALREAIGDLAGYILSLNPSVRRVWAQELQERLGADFGLVLSILPVLRPCFDDSQHRSMDSSLSKESEEKRQDPQVDAFGDFSTNEYRFVRFRLAFRTLIRFACAKLRQGQQHPTTTLIFVLDDLHWVDPDSLQIIKTLIEDSQKATNFFLLAATRPLDGFSHLHNLYRSLTQPTPQQQRQPPQSTDTLASSSSRSFGVKKTLHDKLRVVGVSRLSVAEINSILRALLKRNDVQDLADLVKSKTQGNAFVVFQFLRLLERSGRLWYSHSHSHGQWNFDLASIAKVDQISDNVSQVVARSLACSGRRRRSALMVAASFGVSQFDVSTIVHAVTVLEHPPEGESSSSSSEEYEDPYLVRQRVSDMSSELTEAALEGYVEETSPGHFRFSHDRIRETAYSLLPPGNSRKEVHLRVGRQLRSWMDTQSELGLQQSGFSKESLLLHATKQLNAGSDLIHDDWEILDLVDLNYQAAELAATKTAFFSAIEYLQVGLVHLGGGGQDAWTGHYDTTLKLHVALARMQFSCGLLDSCWETSDAVIAHAKSFWDKSGIYHTRILCLMQQELMKEALDLTLDLFEMMGQPMPRRFVLLHAIKDLVKARRFLKETSDEELLSFPTVYQEDVETQLNFLQTLAEIGFLCGNFGYVMLVSFRYVLLVADKGNYPRSFYATALWACFFKAQMGDFSEAMHYGTLATTLSAQQRESVPGFAARCDEMFLGYVHHWRFPIRESLAPTMDAFQRLWGSGMVDTALMDNSTLLQHFFAAGETVGATLEQCERASEAFQDYQQMYHWHLNAPQHQAMLNFMGQCNNPAVLTGSHMDARTCHKNWIATSNKPALYNHQFWSVVVGYHFGDLQRAKHHIKAMRRDLMEDGSTVLVPLRLLYTGLVYLALCRATRKPKYRRRAMKAWKQLQKWSDQGAINCGYMCQLLRAEDLSSRASTPKNVRATILAYERALESATKLGLVHHQALVNELAGVYLLYQNQEDDFATAYLDRAVELYARWGAVAKVKDLRSKFSAFLATSQTFSIAS